MTDDLSKQLAEMRQRHGINSTVGRICSNMVEINKAFGHATDDWCIANLKRSMRVHADYLGKLVGGNG